MNYLPYCGYWFYAADDTPSMHLAFVSWGLIMSAPAPPVIMPGRRMGLLLGVY